MKASDLVGAWRLVDFTVAFDDGRPPVRPFGDDAEGRLIYSADGHVSALLSRGDRRSLWVDGLESAHRASLPDKAAAFDSALGYAGRYHVDGDEVVHTVEVSLLPDAVGRAQRRHVALCGARMVLSYDWTAPSGTVRHHRLTWIRMEAP